MYTPLKITCWWYILEGTPALRTNKHLFKIVLSLITGPLGLGRWFCWVWLPAHGCSQSSLQLQVSGIQHCLLYPQAPGRHASVAHIGMQANIYAQEIKYFLKEPVNHWSVGNTIWLMIMVTGAYIIDKYKCPPHADFYPLSPRLKFLASFVRIFKGQCCLNERIGLIDFIKILCLLFWVGKICPNSPFCNISVSKDFRK